MLTGSLSRHSESYRGRHAFPPQAVLLLGTFIPHSLYSTHSISGATCSGSCPLKKPALGCWVPSDKANFISPQHCISTHILYTTQRYTCWYLFYYRNQFPGYPFVWQKSTFTWLSWLTEVTHSMAQTGWTQPPFITRSPSPSSPHKSHRHYRKNLDHSAEKEESPNDLKKAID